MTKKKTAIKINIKKGAFYTASEVAIIMGRTTKCIIDKIKKKQLNGNHDGKGFYTCGDAVLDHLKGLTLVNTDNHQQIPDINQQSAIKQQSKTNKKN